MFFTNLETEILLLKNIDVNDREFIFDMFSDEVVNKYLFDAEPLTDISGADEIIEFYLENSRIIEFLRIQTSHFHEVIFQDSRIFPSKHLNGYSEMVSQRS